MKLTRKKKQQAISENLVNAHALAKALNYSLQVVKENVGLLEDETLREAIKQLIPKLNYFDKQFVRIFEGDERAKVYLEGNFNHLDEYSMKIIEATETILNDKTT
jgi:formiminotetrahydrofolate cyclodeaminase